MANRLLISDDMIYAIDRIQSQEREKYKQNKQQDKTNIPNPILKIIRSEWHYSNSSRLFENTDTSWQDLEKFEIIHIMAKNLSNINIDVFVGGEFELSSATWYQPYHYFPRTQWGIHIRYDSWMRIAAKFSRNCSSLLSKDVDSIKAAFLYLFTHSLFHYVTENASSIMEIVSEDPHIYTNYHSNIYARSFNSSDCLEEALANRYLFGKCKEFHIDSKFLKEELSKQGSGYRNFVDYFGSSFQKGIRRLLTQIQQGTLNPQYDKPLEQLIDIVNPIDYSHRHRVPVWLRSNAKPLDELRML